jgi:myo-inositol 2-dehydrogenase/D-chiro-inositol 1-dehydrogenase
MFNKIDNSLSRRNFVKGAAALSMTSLLARSGAVFAAGSETIRIGLVGCGGRGNGALRNCLDAAKHLNLNTEVVALADYFMDRAVDTAKKFAVPEDRCHSGAGAYKKVMASNADVVVIATSPNFRPVHFEAAVKAGKHVFMEKPVAVDPPGARKIMAAGKLAAEKKLAVVAGTQRHHQAEYRQTQHAIANNAIGKLISGQVVWCGGQLWYKTRNPGESDADYMIRNWVSFTETSGDHIVEQHVHNIDVANWFIGRPPKSAFGFGGRARRKTGNQFDFFSVDFDYGDDLHIHSMCRQVKGCYSRVSEYFTGTEGSTWGTGPGKDGYKKQIQIPDFEEHSGGPYVQEHVDLLRGIIEGKPLNEAQAVAESTLTGIMGRISAYSGQFVRWNELVDESLGSPWYSLKLSPSAEDFENGTVKAPADDVIAIPGKDETVKTPADNKAAVAEKK